MTPTSRAVLQFPSKNVPYTTRENNTLVIKTRPRESDSVDSFIEYSYKGSLALIGGGGVGLLGDYLTSNDREDSYNLPFLSLAGGVLWGGVTRLVVTLNNYRHTQNFYRLYDQAQAQIRADQGPNRAHQ